MAEAAALLADEILPERPLRQWVLSLPMALRFLLATRPAALSAVFGAVHRTISGHLLREARLSRCNGHTGAVTLVQRFGSALKLNVRLHMGLVDGAYRSDGTAPPVFHRVPLSPLRALAVAVLWFPKGRGATEPSRKSGRPKVSFPHGP